MSKIISLTGTHCSGKTSSCLRLAELDNVEFFRTDLLDVYSKYRGSARSQIAIAEKVYDTMKKAEACAKEFAVIDRSFIDIDAYSEYYDNVDSDDAFAIEEMKDRTRLDLVFVLKPLPLVLREGKTDGIYNTQTQKEVHDILLRKAQLSKTPYVLVDLLKQDIVDVFKTWTNGL